MHIQITKALPEDAEGLIEFLNTVGAETDNLSFGAEGFGISVENERKYLERMIDSQTSVMFVARIDGKIVGNASFSAVPRDRMKHRGSFAVAVVKSAWGQGIGSRLLEAVINFAKDTAHAEIISLEVRSDNTRAIKLYEKYGFTKIGHFNGFFKINGEYIDCDLMNLYL